MIFQMDKILKDSFHMEDTVECKQKHSPTLWHHTQIIGGYGLHKDSRGISHLGEVVFTTENMVPLTGVQYAMEMIYGVKGPIEIPTLNDTMQIGAIGSTIAASDGMPYPYGQKVCLFGVGTGGAAENNITALEVKYNETSIVDMIPFRYSGEELSTSDSAKYFGKRSVDGVTAYYLKKFDSDPTIRHLYKNGEEGEDGSEVDSTFFNTLTAMGVESFTEAVLSINKKDIREWFTYNGNIEECRINSIALFSAIYDAALKDYANILLFSKLNIPSEPLSLSKDLHIIYRTYGA
jgi:hypothetical protein